MVAGQAAAPIVADPSKIEFIATDSFLPSRVSFYPARLVFFTHHFFNPQQSPSFALHPSLECRASAPAHDHSIPLGGTTHAIHQARSSRRAFYKCFVIYLCACLGKSIRSSRHGLKLPADTRATAAAPAPAGPATTNPTAAVQDVYWHGPQERRTVRSSRFRRPGLQARQSGQRQAYEGKSVKVTGQLDEQAMLIHVESIEGNEA